MFCRTTLRRSSTRDTSTILIPKYPARNVSFTVANGLSTKNVWDTVYPVMPILKRRIRCTVCGYNQYVANRTHLTSPRTPILKYDCAAPRPPIIKNHCAAPRQKIILVNHRMAVRSYTNTRLHMFGHRRRIVCQQGRKHCFYQCRGGIPLPYWRYKRAILVHIRAPRCRQPKHRARD